MTSILNIFSDKENNEIIKNKNVSSSLKQGKKFKKYQNKIKNSLEKNAEIVSGEEGFSNMEGRSLTKETNDIIDDNNYSSQQQIIDNLKKEYEKTLNEYEELVSKLSGNLNAYIDRVNPNNPYLNKTIRFTTGHVCYVTNQGLVKYIPSPTIWQSVNIPQNYININLPWINSYSTPGTEIPTNPPLISGTFMKYGQSVGSEGSNVFVNQFLPKNTDPKYMGCYATNSSNNNMSFIGGSPPPNSNASIENGSFTQPVLSNNSYRYITGTSVPGWYFTSGAVLVNNSSAWGFTTPYPNGNQCVSLQNTGSISQIVPLLVGVTYRISFYSCGRPCCTGPNTANLVNVQLYTTSNQWIQNIYQYTPPVNKWTRYTATFSVQVTGSYKLFFSGANNQGDRSSAIQNIVLNSSGTSSNGSFSHDACEQAAINGGYRYFGLQNVNTSNNLGYCAVSNSEPSVTQYGTSNVPNKAIALWSSNTANQTGNSAILQTSGSLQVINSGGQSVYSSPGGNPSNYLGCYNDCYQGRGLPTYLGNGKNYSSCQSAAQSGNWSYFGLQFTQANGTSECWVGNDISNGTKMGKANNCTVVNGVNVGGGCSNAIYNNKSATSNYFLILQDDGNMCVYRGTGPNDNQGYIWCTMTNGKQQSANPNMVATKGKYGKNWISSGSTLAPGDFIGSTNGNLALVMQSDGNLVLYTYQMQTNCQKMSDGNMGGGQGANAAYDIGKTAVSKNMGAIGYIDADSNIYSYPTSNQQYTDTYTTKISGMDTWGNDIPGAAFGNATLQSCQTACNNNSQCAGIVTNAAGNYCWPKTNSMYPFGGPSGVNSDRNIYVRGRKPSTPPLGVSQNTNTIDSVTYQNYINKGQVGSQYGLANASSTQKQQLEQLQTRMSLLSNKINNLTNKFQGGSITAENQSVANNTGIDHYIKNIKNTNQKIGVIAGESNGNVQNILKDSDIVVLQKNYDYLFWSILATGTVLVSMNIVNKQ